jgi:hypothetical protein
MRLSSLALVTLVCLAVVACDTNKKAPAPAPGAGGQPNAGAAGALPPGHPPLGGSGMGAGMGMGAGAPRAEAPLIWTVPAGWQVTAPSSSMRIAQFQLADVDGMAVECKIFGGILGGVDANIERWVGQFKTPEGGPITDGTKITKSESNGLTVTTLDVSGIFGGGMGATAAGDEQQTWRMLASVVEGAPTPIQVQLVGPADVVSEHAERYQQFVESLKTK